ncbi:DASH complex subunit Duo1 [Kalmanozyma brasiliensis GHG001]|uniref:DASH complex subunit DUO1 n=1 Tax=Kalmanozyma brasiliensis (strain GHG001) TaxID=1365824 RepID=V5E9K1_KALBG|nr:DASH complex subunit Duo1 [Kalmanozyma brasiliensis GHG001]EST07021.1 DASH complex subunit Duo1 [Kalmanozyma brasiliensis GHG001]
MPALPHTPKPSNPDAADSSWLLDENLSPALVQGSLRDLNISDSPVNGPLRSGASANASATTVSGIKKPMKSRPSWGSAAVLDSTTSTKGMSNMRLLAGLDVNDENKPPISRRAPTASGAGRPRFSLFAKPGVPTNLVPKKTATSEPDEDDDDDLTIAGLSDASALAPTALDSSAIDVDDEYIREALLGTRSSARQSIGGPTPTESKESQEQTARQLTELRRMNDVFEAFERMLRGSAGQINAFARRVQETDDLLNIYIGLLRQTEKTQQLLQDQDWKGTSEDASAHALSVALAERETQRLQAEAAAREEEAQRAAEEAAMRAEEDERRRQDDARRAAAGGGRGRGRVVSTGTRGTARGAARGASTAATRGRAVSSRAATTTDAACGTASTRGAPASTRGRSASATGTGISRPSGIPTRATSGSAGLGGQYANVKSSGYGPR